MTLDSLTQVRFETAIDDWAEHHVTVAPLSSPRHLVGCDAYKKLVSMGPKILPLVREVYEPDYQRKRGILKDTTRDYEALRRVGLCILVNELAGGYFKIPEEARGDFEAARNFTIGWLDFNMHRYS